MARIFTEEQTKAILTGDCNLIVSAAAGSGKTAVLVERIIRKITNFENNKNIDDFLVVTFTNAAASEMKERIEEALNKIIEEPDLDKEYISNITKQITLLPIANITTIHSFCLNVIRDNIHKTDLDPKFRVADDSEVNILINEALEELFEEELSKEENGNFIELMYTFDERRETRLKETILDLYRFSRSLPDFKSWLFNSCEKLNISNWTDFLNSFYGNKLFHLLKAQIKNFIDAVSQGELFLKETPGLSKYYYSFVDLREALEGLNAYNELDQLLEEMRLFDIEDLPRTRGYEDEKANAKALRKFVKDSIDDIKKNYCKSHEYILKSLKGSYRVLKELALATLKFHDIFSTKKREKGIIDFNDMEQMCFEILLEKDVSKIYMDKFSEILIDEYQDSNRIQEEILKSISRVNSPYNSPNIFMVGDVKQSIYGFRNACPDMFIEKYRSYRDDGLYRKIKLYKNFRSSKRILSSVNEIFKMIMSQEIGGIDYDEEEFLIFGSDTEDKGEVSINILNYDKEYETDSEEELTTIQAEARMVGKLINDLIQKKQMIKRDEKFKEIDYRDIVILSRTTEKVNRIFLDELSTWGIPVYADAKTGYFESYEIKIMISLLCIIDNPYQDISLLSVLKSPIGGFTPDEIMDIRLVDEESYLYDNMLTMDNKKVKDFIERLNFYRKEAGHLKIHELIWKLFTETGFYGYVAALPYGNERRANLKLLFKKGKDFEEGNFRGLFNFINFINKFKQNDGDFGSASTIGENENVVRLMSIHKSKGLEFPVVFLIRASKNINFADLKKKLVYNNDLGLGIDYTDINKRVIMTSIVKDLIKNTLKTQVLSEEMRLLYVAMTRAKYKLIITGSVSNLDKSYLKWQSSLKYTSSKLSDFYINSCKNFFDLIMPSAILNKEIFETKAWEMMDIDKSRFIQRNDVDKSNETMKVYEEIDRRLSYVYPFDKFTKLPGFVTVTELKRRWEIFEEDEYNENDRLIIESPRFLSPHRNIKGNEVGMLNHLFLQHLDLNREYTYISLNEEIQKMINEEKITQDQRMFIMVKNIMSFLSSDLVKRIRKSNFVKKEFPFQSLFPSRELFVLDFDDVQDDLVMVQGIIDLFFEEDGDIVLLDYKTDSKLNDSIVLNYERQLNIYSKCLEKILEKKVKEKLIYLLSKDELIKL
ncbi:MAG: helicase-exonuclease AddAB subunit AddA [Oscillospiraceae bacterium]|nr:helicase-exonuclease AddAB subunit AddA [Oscillospiraceae bacterium]